MKKPKLKKYPIGGTKGFIPDTMVHYIGAGEVPYSKDQLSSMGYNYETSTGGFDEYSMGNNRRFYKTISPGTPEWNNPENPYLNAVASTQPVVKPAPKLKWPTRTDYSKGSKGPIYTDPTFSHGGMKLPKYFNGGTESSSMIEDYRAEDGSNFWDGANGQESYYKSQEPVAPAAYGQQNNSGYKPNYNAMIGNSAMATANYANVYQDPDATTSDKAAAARQGAAQIAGSINPMIGSIIGGVDAIAKPIKNNAEQMNSKGQLTNRNKARAGAIAGNILSPSTLATTIASGKWDLKGDKYLNELEGNAQAQIAAEQAPMLAAAEAKRNMYYTYAQGGVHSGMPNAELENREMYNIPGGPISEVNGPSHEQGGVPVSIPNGTEMLPDNSDSLKINAKIVKMFPNLFSKKDIGKTFSDTSRNLKTTKEDKIMKDDKASNLSKSTASLNIAVKKAKYQQKMKALEEFKKSKLQDYAKKLGLGISNKFPNGGTMYNPNLAKDDKSFQDWYSKNTLEGKNKIPYSDKLDYDYYSFYKNKGVGDIENHFPDTYKRPNHETFSNESIYSTPENPGGYWKDDKYMKNGKFLYPNGGTKLPKFINGGIGYIDPENLRLAQQAQSGFPAMEQVEDPSFNNALFNKYQTPFIKPSEAERLNKERANLKQPYVPNPNDPYEQAMAAGKEFDTPATSTGRKMNPDWIEPATNTLMQNVGNLMYLKDQGKKYDKQDFYKYSPELYNPADALRQADIEARVNRGRLKDASGGNAGALMSNLTQAQAINTLLKSKIRNDASNQNANTLNDAQVRNIQGKYSVDDINARNKGQALTNYYNAISGVGHNTSAAYRDWKRGDVDQQTLDIISKNYPDYVYDKRRKGWFHKSTGKQLQ